MSEISTKPYLLRALHEWCSDSGYTPHLVVRVDENCRVPMAYVSEGQITLNIGLFATQNLKMGNEFIEFQARFGGTPQHVSVPVGAVTALYSRETGAGMGFEVELSVAPSEEDEASEATDAAPELASPPAAATPDTPASPPSSAPSHLRLVK